MSVHPSVCVCPCVTKSANLLWSHLVVHGSFERLLSPVSGGLNIHAMTRDLDLFIQRQSDPLMKIMFLAFILSICNEDDAFSHHWIPFDVIWKRYHHSTDIATKVYRGHCVSEISSYATFGGDRSIKDFTSWVWNITILCVFIVFLFRFLFYSCLQHKRLTDIDCWWLKMRGLAKGSAFCMIELFQITTGWYPLQAALTHPRCCYVSANFILDFEQFP